MKWAELVKFSVQSLWRRRLRTVLTVLGVMIGTASIVIMMSIGVGLDHSFTEQIESSGTLTLIRVSNYGGGMISKEGSVAGGSEELALTRDVIDGFAGLENVSCSSPVYTFDMMARCGSYEGYLYVNALTYDMLEALKLPILKGQMPERGAPLTFMSGRRVAYNFYDPNGGDYYYYYGGPGEVEPEPLVNLMEDSIFVIYDMNAYWNAQSGMGTMPKKYMLDVSAVIGVESSDNGWSQYDYNTYADIDAVEAFFQKAFHKNPWPGQMTDSKGKAVMPMTYNEAYVLVDDINNVAAVQKQIIDMGFEAYSDLDYINSMREQSKTIQYVLAGIGSISLIVAGIGIMNTMLMSIFERTKEIGIFKVLGCSLPNIRSMFLAEAAIIGLVGGVFGIALSFLLSIPINIFLGGISLIPLWLVAVGLVVAVGVGMVAGISPALRAMKLSPLEAIRSL